LWYSGIERLSEKSGYTIHKTRFVRRSYFFGRQFVNRLLHIIAYAFYRYGYIETWGRGIERITEACEYARKPKPLFEASPGEIKVTFFTDIDTTVNGKPDNNTNDTVKDTINDTQRRILKLFTANAKTTVQAISAELGINERNVKKNIKALKDAGLVKRVGAAKSGHWIVIQPKIDRADKPATTVIRRKK